MQSVWMVDAPTFYWDYPRTEKFLRSFEEKHNLTVIPSSWEVEQKRDTGYHSQNQQNATESIKTRLQNLLDRACSRVSTESELIQNLQQHRVSVRLRASTGWSFALNGIAFKASQLGKKYSRKRLMVAQHLDNNLKKQNTSSKEESEDNNTTLFGGRVENSPQMGDILDSAFSNSEEGNKLPSKTRHDINKQQPTDNGDRDRENNDTSNSDSVARTKKVQELKNKAEKLDRKAAQLNSGEAAADGFDLLSFGLKGLASIYRLRSELLADFTEQFHQEVKRKEDNQPQNPHSPESQQIDQQTTEKLAEVAHQISNLDKSVEKKLSL